MMTLGSSAQRVEQSDISQTLSHGYGCPQGRDPPLWELPLIHKSGPWQLIYSAWSRPLQAAQEHTPDPVGFPLLGGLSCSQEKKLLVQAASL